MRERGVGGLSHVIPQTDVLHITAAIHQLNTQKISPTEQQVCRLELLHLYERKHATINSTM